MGDHAILSKKQDIGNFSIHSQDNSLKEAKNIDVKEIFKNNQKEKKNVNHSSTVRIEYDYDFLENPTEKDERNETKDDKPEYYYYYYYDNIDPEFKNSDELFTSENHSYEPLPTPLSLVSDILDGATIASNADGQDKKQTMGSSLIKEDEIGKLHNFPQKYKNSINIHSVYRKEPQTPYYMVSTFLDQYR